MIDLLIERLNAPTKEERLTALKELVMLGKQKPIKNAFGANNHIHTTYSFSPYSPTKAAYMAYRAGLTSAGIMDHDTLSGAEEFKRACEILGIGATCGVELRCKLNRGFGKINNPDQDNIMYVLIHGVPQKSIAPFNEFLAPYRKKRLERDKKMCKLISDKYRAFGIELDFDKDVLPLSEYGDGGTVTERHLLKALAKKLLKKFGRSLDLISFLETRLNVSVSKKQKRYLLDDKNEHFIYDLLGVLKADASFFYIDADEELLTAEELVSIALKFGAIPAWSYLGDVKSSVTGDKRAQKFEDSYLEQLGACVKEIGFLACAYAPSRNTPEQLKRLFSVVKEHNLFEVSGEDINTPRQEFTCPLLSLPEYSHLITSTWALIGHEKVCDEKGLDYGLFGKSAIKEQMSLDERVKALAKIGKQTINF